MLLSQGDGLITVEPLNDEDYAFMEEVLQRFCQRNGINLEALDGFFAALICSPKLLMPSQYLPEIIGTAELTGEGFAHREEAQHFMELMIHHWNSIAAQLFSGECFTPLLMVDQKGRADGNDWAIGFMRGMALCSDEAWDELLEDERHNELLLPIFALGYEHSPDPELRIYHKPIRVRQRKQLIGAMANSVTELYAYFKPYRLQASHRKKAVATAGRTSLQADPQGPCPCGSGRPYQDCCVKITLH